MMTLKINENRYFARRKALRQSEKGPHCTDYIYLGLNPYSHYSILMHTVSSALIGHTGFVGHHLATQHDFSECFNSKNITEIKGRSFDLIVCAGVYAKKWWANSHPDEDWQSIEKLLTVLATVKARQFVLISTIDVYPNPQGVIEDTHPDAAVNHAYGQHRLKVEGFVQKHFASHNILRLTGLFGEGLKKNVIFDLMNDNCLDAIQPESSFQYYNLENIWRDVGMARQNNLKILNLACEPIATKRIIEKFFPGKIVGQKAVAPVHYDMRSKYAALWGAHGSYQYDADTVLKDLGRFIQGGSR